VLLVLFAANVLLLLNRVVEELKVSRHLTKIREIDRRLVLEHKRALWAMKGQREA